MATKKVFKTMFEVRDEEAYAKGYARGYARGYAIGISKSIRAIIKWFSLTDAEIAKQFSVDEGLVKSVRQEFMASQQQA
jgi:hypothetical protein